MKYTLIAILFLSNNSLFAQSGITIQNPTFNAPTMVGGSHNNQYNYSDPNYVPDSINLQCELWEKDKLAFAPKYGTWNNLFIIYPDTFFIGDTVYAGTARINILKDCNNAVGVEQCTIGSGTIVYKGVKYRAYFKELVGSICSTGVPYCIKILSKNSFFIFGNCGRCQDPSKWYIYDYGKVYWYPNDKNVLKQPKN